MAHAPNQEVLVHPCHGQFNLNCVIRVAESEFAIPNPAQPGQAAVCGVPSRPPGPHRAFQVLSTDRSRVDGREGLVLQMLKKQPTVAAANPSFSLQGSLSPSLALTSSLFTLSDLGLSPSRSLSLGCACSAAAGCWTLNLKPLSR